MAKRKSVAAALRGPSAEAAAAANEQLRQLLPELHGYEGFPTADDAAIVDLSIAPEYTACPNPFLAQALEQWGAGKAEDYRRAPFAADVSEGKTDPIYQAQVYHTKVPPKAIARYIEHYCPKDGVVFDGFSGSGMTGVAARCTGRFAVLADLAPAATAIAASFCLPCDNAAAQAAAHDLLAYLQSECGWLYEVRDEGGGLQATVDYVIWSEVYRCPNCLNEASFADIGFDFEEKTPLETVTCSECQMVLEGDDLERCLDADGKTLEVPVRVKYQGRGRVPETALTEADQRLVDEVAARQIPFAYPDDWMMHCPPETEHGWGDMWRRGYHTGYWRTSDFYTRRTLWVIAAALHWVKEADLPPALGHLLRTSIINASINLTRMRRAYQGIIPLVLYLPRMRRECNAIRTLKNRLKTTIEALAVLPDEHRVVISTQSSTSLPNIPDDSIDYIFTDPPFGSNICYSEVNFLWESWLGVTTNQTPEAIMSPRQGKGLPEYQQLMERCFAEANRILKPGHWMTVEFHNSRNSVWISIQEALQRAGFVIADVRILDKQQQSFKQASTAGAVKQDLVISAYRPGEAIAEAFGHEEAPAAESVWDFAREHLRQLPVLVDAGQTLEVLAERQDYLLYDRMVAFYIVRGWPVPIGAPDFYLGLRQRFPERDGMFFLEDQVATYDVKRAQVTKVKQLSLFVTDEKSGVMWLRQLLAEQPTAYRDLQPKFLQELHKAQHEKLPELMELLQENFIRDEEGRWYVPDPASRADLEKLRERALLREFDSYLLQPRRTLEDQDALPGLAEVGRRVRPLARLRTFRTEAVRVGFKACWQARDYQTIVSVGKRLPETVLQEDPDLLMYYDNALTRIGEE